MQYEMTDSLEFFRKRLEEADFDVILADFNLHSWTAMDALETLKLSGKDIPLIVVTGSLGDEAAVDCIKHWSGGLCSQGPTGATTGSDPAGSGRETAAYRKQTGLRSHLSPSCHCGVVL